MPVTSLTKRGLLVLRSNRYLHSRTVNFYFRTKTSRSARFHTADLRALHGVITTNDKVALLPTLTIPPRHGHSKIICLPYVGPRPHHAVNLICHPNSPLHDHCRRLTRTVHTQVSNRFSGILGRTIWAIWHDCPVNFHRHQMIGNNISRMLGDITTAFLFRGHLASVGGFNDTLTGTIGARGLFYFPVRRGFRHTRIRTSSLYTYRVFGLNTTRFV